MIKKVIIVFVFVGLSTLQKFSGISPDTLQLCRVEVSRLNEAHTMNPLFAVASNAFSFHLDTANKQD